METVLESEQDLDHLADCLRDCEELLESPFLHVSFSTVLQQLSDSLLRSDHDDTETQLPFKGWYSRQLLAFDLAADPRRVGNWDWNYEHFPMRPGCNGVTWSAACGYEHCEDCDWSDMDSEEEREHVRYVRKQRALERNIEVRVSFIRSAAALA